jgi:acyl transferase domain-containing protein
MLVGVPVAPELIRELAERVEEPAASTLRDGLDRGRATFALTIEEREQLLRGLEDWPDGLAELRGVLVRELEWRKRIGLV